jgi:hypothetical protein
LCGAGVAAGETFMAFALVFAVLLPARGAALPAVKRERGKGHAAAHNCTKSWDLGGPCGGGGGSRECKS